ncbi:MAG: hypothetical protein V5A27_08810 [Halapricum sp.]
MSGKCTDDDRRDPTGQEPLRGRVVDDSLADVVHQTVSHSEHFGEEARSDCL